LGAMSAELAPLQSQTPSRHAAPRAISIVLIIGPRGNFPSGPMEATWLRRSWPRASQRQAIDQDDLRKLDVPSRAANRGMADHTRPSRRSVSCAHGRMMWTPALNDMLSVSADDPNTCGHRPVNSKLLTRSPVRLDVYNLGSPFRR
jgi:hypothetical protein